jgi:hypothetical protein
MLKRFLSPTLVAIIVGCVLGFVPYQSVQAAGRCAPGQGTFHVTTTAELIDAIKVANCDPADNIIELQNPSQREVFTLTRVNNTAGGANGLPVIANAATAGKLTINGNNAIIQRDSTSDFRIFQVASGGNLTLNQVGIGYGRNRHGGGIFNSGMLTLNNAVVCDHSAS